MSHPPSIRLSLEAMDLLECKLSASGRLIHEEEQSVGLTRCAAVDLVVEVVANEGFEGDQLGFD